jgi:hypothetical protein
MRSRRGPKENHFFFEAAHTAENSDPDSRAAHEKIPRCMQRLIEEGSNREDFRPSEDGEDA